MLTAEDANKQAHVKLKTSKDWTLDGYLMLVEGAIQNAVSRGEFSVSINAFGWGEKAIKETKDVLKKFGYLARDTGITIDGVDQ